MLVEWHSYYKGLKDGYLGEIWGKTGVGRRDTRKAVRSRMRREVRKLYLYFGSKS